MNDFFAAQAERLTTFQLPSYSQDFNPIEFLWKKVKKQATHLKYFPLYWIWSSLSVNHYVSLPRFPVKSWP